MKKTLISLFNVLLAGVLLFTGCSSVKTYANLREMYDSGYFDENIAEGMKDYDPSYLTGKAVYIDEKTIGYEYYLVQEFSDELIHISIPQFEKNMEEAEPRMQQVISGFLKHVDIQEMNLKTSIIYYPTGEVLAEYTYSNTKN